MHFPLLFCQPHDDMPKVRGTLNDDEEFTYPDFDMPDMMAPFASQRQPSSYAGASSAPATSLVQQHHHRQSLEAGGPTSGKVSSFCLPSRGELVKDQDVRIAMATAERSGNDASAHLLEKMLQWVQVQKPLMKQDESSGRLLLARYQFDPMLLLQSDCELGTLLLEHPDEFNTLLTSCWTAESGEMVWYH